MIICAKLEALGVSSWIAPRDIAPGESYPVAILTAIETSRAVLVLLTRHANASAFVAREVERAGSLDLPIYVLRLEPEQPAKSMALFLSNKQWIDAFDGQVESAVARLASVLAGKDPRSPSVAGARARPRSRRLLVASVVTTILIVGTLWWQTWRDADLRRTPEDVLQRFFDASHRGLDDRTYQELLSPRARASMSPSQWQAIFAAARLFSDSASGPRVTIARRTPSSRALAMPAGNFVAFETERKRGDGQACEQIWLGDDRDAGWLVERYAYWPSTSGRCLGDADLRAADLSAREVLQRIVEGTQLESDHVSSLLRPFTDSSDGERALATLQQYLAGWRVPAAAISSVPMPGYQLPGGPATTGDFVVLRYSADRNTLHENLDLWMHREADRNWRIAGLPIMSPYGGQ